MNVNYLKYFPETRDTESYNEYISFIEEKEIRENNNRRIHVIHHIVPRAFLPEDWRNDFEADIDNLIKLTPYEHLQAHYLLYKAFPNTSMALALRLLINDKNRYNLDISGISEEEFNEVNEKSKQAVSFKLKKFYSENEEIHQRLSDARKGRIFINNGIIEKFIYPDEAKVLIENGWSHGMIKGRKKSEQMKQKLSQSTQNRYKGYKYIFNLKNPDICRRVLPEEAEEFIKTGEWDYGRGNIKVNRDTSYLRAPEILKKQSETKKTLISINNGKKTKRVRPEKLEEYLSSGWVRGTFVSEETKRKRRESSLGKPHKLSEETKNKIRESNRRRKGNKWVSKDGVQKEVSPEELNAHLINGWSLGGIKNKGV